MREQFKQEWRRGVYREVFRQGDTLVKRYFIPRGTPRVQRSWVREHQALLRLGTPESYGYSQRDTPGTPGQAVVFRRRFLDGETVTTLDPCELARCLAGMHALGVVGLDPHPGNFLRGRAGRLHMIDLGRAVSVPPDSFRLHWAVGSEFTWVRRINWRGDPEAFDAFAAAYRQVRPRGYRLIRLVMGLRQAFRGVNLKARSKAKSKAKQAS